MPGRLTDKAAQPARTILETANLHLSPFDSAVVSGVGGLNSFQIMGYLNGYTDREYLDALPKFRLPMLSQTGTYRAFEITGDAMAPVASGTVIVGRYVTDWASIQDGTPCIIVSSKDGIVFKRLFNKLRVSGTVALHSDNPAYSPYEVQADDILEIWEAKSYISRTFPIGELSLDRVASLVLDLQQQVANLKRHY